jgi:hypothetical protein
MPVSMRVTTVVISASDMRFSKSTAETRSAGGLGPF